MKSPFLKGAAVGAVAVLAALTTTIASAGSGIGATLNLGQTNTVDRGTTLVGTAGQKMLRVENKGAGTALALVVQPGVAPMRVSSSVKVANLNADLLDGIDAASLIQGAGKVVQGRLTESLDSGNATILSVPGWGTIEASCGSGGVPNYRLFWRNGLSGATTDVWWSDGTVVSANLAVDYASLAPDSGTYVAPIDTPNDRTVEVTAGYQSPSGPRTMTLTVSAHSGVSGCVFAAQAIAQ